MPPIAPKDRIIVALDRPSPEEALFIVNQLKGQISFYKIGLELLFAGGQTLAKQLIKDGNKIFIDAKILDIGTTMERSVRNIAKLGADFLTLHITDQKTLKAAVTGRGDSGLKLLGVTVMTNLDQQDLKEQGVENETPSSLVLKRAKLAKEAGLDGVIASPLEAKAIREIVGDDFLIVTPGIRPKGADKGDQIRVKTPKEALDDGADYLVIGRPITRADDPTQAAQEIIEETSLM